LILLGEEKARELLAPRNEFIRVSDYQKKGDEIYKARVHYSFNYYLDGLASAAEIQVKPRDVEPHH